MNGSIFDLIGEEPKEGQEGYFELAQNAPSPKDNSYFNTIKDYGKTILKGAVEGVSRFGTALGPLQPRAVTEQQLEGQTEALDTALPTDEGFGQKAIRRGLKEAPTAMAFPGSNVAQMGTRSILAGFAGEGAKELGAPEWAQAAAELTAFIGPDITKKILSSGKNEQLIEFAKKMGMSDEQIAPLLNSDFKTKWLAKLAPKRGSTAKALEESKKGIQSVYGAVQNSAAAAKEISEVANGKLINELRHQISQMPSEVRGKIEQDLADLLNNKITGKSLINFYSDVNHYLSGNTKQLATLKEPIKKALGTISPELSKDFDLVNQLYTKYYPISAKLRPDLVSDLITAGEALGLGASLVGAVTTGYVSPVITFLGEKVGRKVAQQLLINPRFQQIGQKMGNAIAEGKYEIVKKLLNEYSSEISKYSPEAGKELQKLSEGELEVLFSGQLKEPK